MSERAPSIRRQRALGVERWRTACGAGNDRRGRPGPYRGAAARARSLPARSGGLSATPARAGCRQRGRCSTGRWAPPARSVVLRVDRSRQRRATGQLSTDAYAPLAYRSGRRARAGRAASDAGLSNDGLGRRPAWNSEAFHSRASADRGCRAGSRPYALSMWLRGKELAPEGDEFEGNQDDHRRPEHVEVEDEQNARFVGTR